MTVDLAGFAAELRALASRAEAELAGECARAAAKEYLAALYVTTPVLTGALRESEHVFGVAGGGAVAVAEVGSDLIYAKFRNDGGTIRSKGPWSLHNAATGQYFGRVVHQTGSHYMERAEAEALPMIEASCRAITDEFIRLP